MTRRVNILLVDDQPSNLLALESILDEMGQNLVARRLRHARAAGAARPRVRGHPARRADARPRRLRDRRASSASASDRATRRSSFSPRCRRSETNVFRGYELGAVDYIFKPFHPEILRSKVNVFVELFRQARGAEAADAGAGAGHQAERADPHRGRGGNRRRRSAGQWRRSSIPRPRG